MEFTDELKQLNASEEAIDWSEGKTWEECYNTCERGDWLAWLFEELYPDDKRRYIIAGRCALTAKHLMNDETTSACETVIKYGRGEANMGDLRAARAAVREAAMRAEWVSASDNAWAARAAASGAASRTAWAVARAAARAAASGAASRTTWAVARAAAWAAASGAASRTAARRAAMTDTYKQCADIIRQELPIESWKV